MYTAVTLLTEPYTFLLLGLTIAMAWLWCRQKPRPRALKLACVLLCLLLVLSTRAAGYLVQGSLEWSYPPSDDVPAPTDTIVVLGGNLLIDDPQGKTARVGDATLYRCQHAARLYKRAGRCLMIVSGGKVDQSLPGPTLAEAMRDYLLEVGIRPEDIILEDKSTTTYENALLSKSLLPAVGAGSVWLVTTASHMRRSERCFRTLGIDVIPAACDRHAVRFRWSLASFVPSAGGITGVTRATHEWIGLLWYRLRGRA